MFMLKNRYVPFKTQPFETVAEKKYSVAFALLFFTDEKIFKVTTLKKPTE